MTEGADLRHLEHNIGSCIEQLGQLLDNTWVVDLMGDEPQMVPASDFGMALMYLDEAACDLILIGAVADEPDTDVADFWRAHRLIEGAKEAVLVAIETLQKIDRRHGW